MQTKTNLKSYYTMGVLHVSERMQKIEASKGKKYAEYRAAWVNRVENREHGSAPINLNVEVTSKCNMACTFCYHSKLPEDDVGNLEIEVFIKTLDDLKNYPEFSSINLNGLGESLLRKDLAKFIEIAKKSGVIDVMFHTNVSIMNRKIAKELIEAGLDKIVFSVDAPEKQKYESMRIMSNTAKGFSFDKVLKNVETFVNMSKELASNVIVRATMVVTDETYSLIDKFIQRWSALADHITIQDLVWRSYYGSWKNGESNALHKDFDTVKKEVVEVGAEFCCPYLFQSAFINQSGKVVPCSNPRARKEMIMGDLKEESIVSIWSNKKYNELRMMHKSNKWYEHPVCAECEIAVTEAIKSAGGYKGLTFNKSDDLTLSQAANNKA